MAVRTYGVNGRNGGFGRSLAAVLAVILAACAARSAAADASVPGTALPGPHRHALDLRYDIYVGGIYVFQFDATLGLDPRAYTVALKGGTSGLVGRLFPWRANVLSEGHVASADPSLLGIVPENFDNVAEWHHKAKRTTVRFAGAGRYSIEHDPPEAESDNDSNGDALPKALPAGIMDPVSASVAALADSARDGSCERRVPVFDGKRRYDLMVHDGGGEATLARSHLSAYTGPALSCRIAVEPISGFSKKRRYVHWEDAGSGNNNPTVWAAQLAPDLPLVPVRFLASLDIGGNVSTMVVHLVHAEVRDDGGTRVLADLANAR